MAGRQSTPVQTSAAGTIPPTGELRIQAARIGNRTAIVDAYRTAPFHLGRPHDRAGDTSTDLIVQNVGPGYLPGDRVTIDIAVGAGGTLSVRGRGATKVYPSPHGIPVTARVALSVAAGGRLVYLPGELIPFRQAVLEQTTRIDVADGGAAALGEILTPGRIAMGESGQFTWLRLDVEARSGGRLCLVERARLDPARRPLTSLARHGPFTVAGALYLIGDGWRLPDAPVIPESVTWAVASGETYSLVRLLGPTAQSVSAAMAGLLTGG